MLITTKTDWAAVAHFIRGTLATLGPLGPLLGVVLGWGLTTITQRRFFEIGSRKEEWRELISTLERCRQKIGEVMACATGDMVPTARDEVRGAQLEGARVIRDRLFIEGPLRAEKVKEDWDRIQELSDRIHPSAASLHSLDGRTFSFTEFNEECSKLLSKLRQAAKRNLRVDI